MKHGGDLAEARTRYGADHTWLDLSTGINPHPWIGAADPMPGDWTRLPSRTDLETLLEAARAAYSVPAGLTLVAAPGAQALIQWLPQLAPAGPVVIVGPTYSEHARSWRLGRREVIEVTAVEDVPEAVPNLVFVNPNNPDGRLTDLAVLTAAAEQSQARGGWVVVDESFADVAVAASAVGHVDGRLPMVVLRSFGKFYGLAGLRLGFAIAPASIVAPLAAALGPWAVSGPALAIGALALADASWAAAMRARLEEEARALDAVLAKTRLRIVGGTSLFRLVRHREAARLHDGLARQGIWVRRFDWASDLLRFGLPPEPADLARLGASLDSLTGT